MKICILSASLYTSPEPRFTEAYVGTIIKYLVSKGHQISVITSCSGWSNGLSLRKIEGVRVYSFYPLNVFERSDALRHHYLTRLFYHGIDHVWNPQSYLMVRRALARERPDVVHVFIWRGFSPSVFDAVRDSGVPLVLTQHDYLMVCPKSTLFRGSGKVCTRQPLPCKMYQATKRLAVDGKVDMVIGVSQFVINKLKELRLFKNATTVTLPNAIELNKQSPVERNSETVNIVYTGVISKHKGVGVLVDAFKQLKQSNVHLHIVGDGGQTAELKKTSGGDGRIKFHGFVSLKGLAELQEIMDIAVVPSVWYEPLPKVIVESFKHGVPVVASNIGGIPEIIENGNNGLLFEAGNATQLKDKLEQLIENPAERKRLGQGAYQSVRKYDINIVIGQLQQIYEQVKGQI